MNVSPCLISTLQSSLKLRAGEYCVVDLNPWGSLHADTIEAANICIMGIPFDGAVSCGKGSSRAPEHIRSLSRYLPATTETGIILDRVSVFDAGDVPVDLDWERYYGNIEAEAYTLFKSGKFCLFIGGDHSVTIPLHKAFGKAMRESGKQKIGIIHFDAHADICDTYDNHKWSHACTERRALDDVISPADLSYVGLRSWELEELEFFASHPEIITIKAYDVYKEGPLQAFQTLYERYADYDAIYFTLDIDVLDPAYAPGTGTPEAGGLSSRELLELTKLIVGTLPVVAMDVVEVSPILDVSDMTSWAALKVIYEAFGCINAR